MIPSPGRIQGAIFHEPDEFTTEVPLPLCSLRADLALLCDDSISIRQAGGGHDVRGCASEVW